jgi:hypothetical protein
VTNTLAYIGRVSLARKESFETSDPVLTIDDFLLITQTPDFIRLQIVKALDELKTGLRDTFGAYCAFRLPDRLPGRLIEGL